MQHLLFVELPRELLLNNLRKSNTQAYEQTYLLSIIFPIRDLRLSAAISASLRSFFTFFCKQAWEPREALVSSLAEEPGLADIIQKQLKETIYLQVIYFLNLN